MNPFFSQTYPEVERSISLRPHAPWYNDSLREAKRKKRQLERKMKKSGLQIDKEIFQEHCKTYHKSLESAKREHYQSKIADCSQKQLFRIADKLTSAKPMKTLPAHESLESLSEEFHTFFDSKIEKIHEKLSKTDVSPVSVDVAESCVSRFDSFDEVDEECVRKIITESAKTSCGLDPIPTSILAKPEILDAMLPVITRIVNMSLRQAIVPSMLKRALVTPLIKKVNLDPDTFKNYRPISNLPFLFKIIERVASSQIQWYVSENSLGGDRQSAYRKQHSTETALLRLSNDILRAIDNHQNVIVVLLDLTAAFDTLDHQILLQRLYNRLGITGTALQWMESYFHERQQCVCIDGICSDWKFVSRGAPQGSVFGPMAFSYYSVPVENIIKAHNLECMVYADDSQIYCCFDNQDMDISVSRVEKCVADVRSWMIRNHLMLNDSKTELLHLTSRFSSTPEAPALRVGDAVVTPSTSARNLGAVINENVTMNQHVNSICRSASFALYNIGKLRPYLDKASTETLIHAFVTSRLDSCNSLLYGLPQNVINKLQRVQNSAARLVTRVRGRVHMKPILRTLHWLPIRKRVLFKILLLTYKAIHGLAPQYIMDLLTIYKPVRCLRSSAAESPQLKPPSHKDIRTITYGDRAFSSAAPREWNRLPTKICAIKTLGAFKRALKTHIFDLPDTA